MAGIQHEDIDHTGLTGVGAGANPQVTTIELGHASDTTLARVSAGVVSIEGTNIVKAGAITSSGLTQATARLLGRSTASTGAVEEITLGTNLSFTGTTLNAAGGGASFVGAKVYNSAAQSIASGSEVVLTFNSEEYDTDAIHDAGAPTLLTVPTGFDGKWRFRASVSVAANSSGSRAIGFRLNAGAGTYIRGGYKTWAPVAGTILTQTIEATITGLVAGDDITVFAFQNTGGNLNVGSTNDWEMTTFEAQFLGA